LILQHLGWDRYFTNVFASDGRQPAYKNKAEMLTDLIRSEALNLESLCYVGDKKEDEDASMANTIPFIGVGWGYKGDNTSWHQQTSAVNSTDELLSLIRND
jgi:phosphoglycolate phosphatase-like HAD superfamily hydrolase